MKGTLCQIDNEHPQIATIVLNRPEKRNALSIELIGQLMQAIQSAADDRNRRVIILRGNGPAFCAGLDLAEAADPQRSDRSAHALAELYTVLCRSPLVTIAAAQGAAFGGGAGLLAACDLVVAADDLKIGFPEVHRGLVAALVTCIVRRQLGDRAVRELVLLGQIVSAQRALEIGLVNRVAPAGQMTEATLDLAKAACKGAPGAIARTKRLLDDLAQRPIAEELQRALAYHLQARNSAESAEGVAAFLQRREPKWGRRLEDP